ncbi:pre-mRNA 3'-end-processing factor FIP1 isoform X2 [Onthophagus taurus]|uniref:pre-mRNA 3'-end-processing factor FIP1 isoform X2 n=1 Tax=Onthophagus taurus TaxID=166361 RepID=UPI000C20C921|nr:pre-mRNA 3'-end-processing factor FIP1 isoform X2 [Onthophagus taurus]
MADDVENDDQWLYGDSSDHIPQENDKPSENNEEVADKPIEEEKPPEIKESETEEAPPEENPEEQQENDEENGAPEDGEIEKQPGDSDKEDFDEDSDDDVNVVIGDIKTSPTYTSLNIKRGGLLTTTTSDKTKQAPAGKFSIDEFDQPGSINGVPATDFNLDSLEDKPWRKPGADITDYFNYGFNEDTWKAYCERQKRLRMNESGVGLAPLNAIGMPRGPVPIMNDNSKYSGNYSTPRKAGPPPGRRMTGSIDVIGGLSTRMGSAAGKMDAPKENVIQVMTADRREYSRKPPGFPDMSMPPPNFDDFQPEYGFNPEPEPFYGGYEPTQDSQWGDTNAGWQPQEIKSLTGGPPPIVPPVGPPTGIPPPMVTALGPTSGPIKEGSPQREIRDQESRGRSEKPRERERERSHRRERSRSRSRRHKSRSRSPSHRSHRKKKSRRHEDSD